MTGGTQEEHRRVEGGSTYVVDPLDSSCSDFDENFALQEDQQLNLGITEGL